MIAAGLHGIDNELALEPAYPGNAYDAVDKPRLPPAACTSRSRCSRGQRPRGRRSVTTSSTTTCTTRARSQRSFEAAVTDWERFRSFERL